jgi:hypothetical protein
MRGSPTSTHARRSTVISRRVEIVGRFGGVWHDASLSGRDGDASGDMSVYALRSWHDRESPCTYPCTSMPPASSRRIARTPVAPAAWTSRTGSHSCKPTCSRTQISGSRSVPEQVRIANRPVPGPLGVHQPNQAGARLVSVLLAPTEPPRRCGLRPPALASSSGGTGPHDERPTVVSQCLGRPCPLRTARRRQDGRVKYRVAPGSD